LEPGEEGEPQAEENRQQQARGWKAPQPPLFGAGTPKSSGQQ
jgi:hypothetical protein